MLDEKGMETLFAWYKQEGIENIGYEDPDLLLFFLGQASADDNEVMDLINKMKQLKYSD